MGFSKLELSTLPTSNSVHKLADSLFIRYNNYTEEILSRAYDTIGGLIDDYQIVRQASSPLDFCIVYKDITIARVKVKLDKSCYKMFIEALDPSEAGHLDS